MGIKSSKNIDPAFPSQGYRVIKLKNIEQSNKIQPFTDYLLLDNKNQVDDKQMKQISIFSTIDYSVRKQHFNLNDLPQMRYTAIKDSPLKITKIFQNSPAQKIGLVLQQYIVGLQQTQFDNIKTFAEALKKLIAIKHQPIVMGICNKSGKVRNVQISLNLFQQWKKIGQGILGCQLAQGWMHQIKQKQKINQKIIVQPLKKQMTAQIQKINNNSIQQVKNDAGSSSSSQQEIYRKLGCQNIGETRQILFKGLLKNEHLQDASTICKCKIYDKFCEKCFIQKQGNYWFFNKKTNRIIGIPFSQLLTITL